MFELCFLFFWLILKLIWWLIKVAFCIIWYPIELIIRIMVKKSQVKKDSSLELEKTVFDECLDEMIRDKREVREEREISGAGIWTLLFLDDLFDD